MFDGIKRYFARRRLRPVVAVLPFALAQRFGNSEFYTAAQVQKTIAHLKIKPALQAYAHAVGLVEEDAIRLDPTVNAERYIALRREIAAAYYMPEDDFTTKDLRQIFGSRRKVGDGAFANNSDGPDTVDSHGSDGH